MINGLLPLSSLKRDEVYSFIAGMYVSVVWFLYLGSKSVEVKSAGLTIYNSCIFIAIWLTSTVIVFVIQLYLSNIMSNTLQEFCNKAKEESVLKILNLNSASRLNYFAVDYYKELAIFIHITGLGFTSALLVFFPLLSLFSSDIRYVVGFVVFQLVFILLVFYQYHRFWLCSCAYACLRRKGRVEVYDEKKYGEEMAIGLSKANVDFNKNLDAKSIFNKLLDQVQILSHEHSAMAGVNLNEDHVEWKWHALVKLANTTNMYNFRKYIHLEYILCDKEGYVLAVSSLSFNDENRVQFLTDKAGVCDDDSVVLTCRATASIPKVYTQLPLLGYCKFQSTCP